MTAWKDSLVKMGGPMLTAKLIELLLEKGEVVGSTGRIYLDEKRSISFDRYKT